MTARRPSIRTDFDALLKGVSRSFYLSIRLLPEALRQPVAVGYLLARAADTMADATRLPAAERQALLETFQQALAQSPPSHAGLQGLVRTAAPAAADPRERALLESLPGCIDAFAALDANDAKLVRTVLAHITRGQVLDVQRFPDDGQVRALGTAAELEEYAFLVAGSVGEFWTDLCTRHLPSFATLPAADMRSLGRRYGMGLQLVNIVRDARADIAMGRCYLPADEIAAAGGDAGAPLEHAIALAAVRSRWLEVAGAGLECGIRYADAVNQRRVRAASALPALIGLRTVALLRRQGIESTSPAKMPRAELRALLWRMGLSLASRPGIAALAHRMREPA